MNKLWNNSGKRDDKIIAIDDQNIYKSNPKDLDLTGTIDRIEEKWSTDARITFAIPLNIIREIRYDESKKYVQIFFGRGSEEHFKANDPNRLKEIFDYFSQHIPNTSSSSLPA